MTSGFLAPLLEAGAAARGSQAGWLAQARSRALEQLVRDGLPGPRSEAWKYSPLRALDQRNYQRDDATAATRGIDPSLLALAAVEGPRLVFVNGTFRADLSIRQAVDGVEVHALSAVLESDPDSVRAFLSRSFDDASDAFARLNSALAVDGPLVRVAPGVIVASPLRLVFVGACAPTDLAWQLRGIVDIG
jgi:Fe-S cluster assembly protein SufD